MNNNLSYKKMWCDFIKDNPQYSKKKIKDVYHFCYNERDANELAELVRKGIKRATSSLYLLYKLENEEAKIPKVGDLSIITNYYGNPFAIIENTLIEFSPFNKVSAEFAFKEGEGDKTLNDWKRTHKEFFNNELKKYNIEFDDSMLVVLEHFKVVYN